MTIYFAPVGSGMGDVIVCLPIFKWLTDNNSEPVFLVARGPRQVNLSKVIPGLAGEVIEPELDAIMQPGDRLINLRDHPLQKYHDWFSEEFQTTYPSFRICEILDTICRDFGIGADVWGMKPFDFVSDERSRGKVIFIPGTTVKVKMMEPQFWLNLYQSLKIAGIECLVLGLLDRCPDTALLVDAGVPHVETPSVQQAIDLLSCARAAVAVDTGLMHIAVQQGIKTVTVYGRCEVYHRPAGNCLPIFTNRFDRTKLATTKPPYSHFAENADLGSYIPRDIDYLQHGYPKHDYPTRYTTWDWHPPDVYEGKYLPFNDHEKVMELLLSV